MNEEGPRQLAERLAVPGEDRSAPVAFAGRGEELAWLRAMLAKAKRGGDGLSCVVQGIPGSGKTSLVREFCRQAEADGAVAVALQSRTFTQPHTVAERLRTRGQEVRTDDGRFHGRLQPDTTVEWGLLSFLKIKFTGRKPRQGDTLSGSLDTIGIPADVPVVCFVDEAHSLPDEARSLVQELHGGIEGRAVLPVYAGIEPRAEDRVRGMSGSLRLAGGAVLSLDPLRVEEAAESISGACRAMGMDADAARRLSERVAPDTHGFAAHIASAVTGVAMAVVKHGPDLPESAVAECRANAREQRRAYYDDRLRAADNPPPPAMAVLAEARETADGWIERKPLRAAWDLAAAQWSARSERPAPTLAQALDACELAGVVRQRERPDGTRLFQFPAPSMAQHLKDMAP